MTRRTPAAPAALAATVAFTVAFTLAIGLAGCGAPPAAVRDTAVGTRIDAFLRAVRDGTESRGWDHLRADVRDAYPGGRDGWLAALDGVDGQPVGWEILETNGDDYTACSRVRILGEVPSALRDPGLPALVRFLAQLDDDWRICATIGPGPEEAGVHGSG